MVKSFEFCNNVCRIFKKMCERKPEERRYILLHVLLKTRVDRCNEYMYQ